MRRKCLAWPRGGWGHTGDCAINQANNFNVQSDHDKVLQGPEASRQTNVHERFTSLCQSPVLWSISMTSPLGGTTTTIRVIDLLAYISQYIHICIHFGGLHLPCFNQVTRMRTTSSKTASMGAYCCVNAAVCRSMVSIRPSRCLFICKNTGTRRLQGHREPFQSLDL